MGRLMIRDRYTKEDVETIEESLAAHKDTEEIVQYIYDKEHISFDLGCDKPKEDLFIEDETNISETLTDKLIVIGDMLELDIDKELTISESLDFIISKLKSMKLEESQNLLNMEDVNDVNILEDLRDHGEPIEGRLLTDKDIESATAIILTDEEKEIFGHLNKSLEEMELTEEDITEKLLEETYRITPNKIDKRRFNRELKSKI